jgi:PKD repeat protein
VDNNGCNVGPVQVDVQPAGNVEVPVTPSLAAICDGEPALLSAAPGFSNYQWSNGALGQNVLVSFSGFYSVTVTDANGCTGTSAQVEVIQSQFPIANFSYTQNNGGYTINFNNSSQNGISYEWQFDTLSTSPLEEPSFTFPENGPFYVTLIIENPCGIDTVTKLVIVAQVGMEDILTKYEAAVFPNPSSSDFNLMLNSDEQENIDLILTDIQGRFMYQNTLSFHGKHTVNIPSSTIANGLYLLHLRTKNGTGTIKLIKN